MRLLKVHCVVGLCNAQILCVNTATHRLLMQVVVVIRARLYSAPMRVNMAPSVQTRSVF